MATKTSQHGDRHMELAQEIRALRAQVAQLQATINVLTTSKAQLMTKRWGKPELMAFLNIGETTFYKIAPQLGYRHNGKGNWHFDPQHVQLQLKSGKLNVPGLSRNEKEEMPPRE
ncbi:MAG: hypothetical protein GY820_38615 [Gammaproteobacteria bacterium]|nr:hypothetical protein [Gammaproteobacteria bacterium]